MRPNTRKRPVDPKQFRRSSNHALHKPASARASGERKPTPTGYKIDVHGGDTFEMYYEAMLPGTCSPRLSHDDKERAFWVLEGQGFLSIQTGKLIADRRLIPGDHVVLEKGSVYKIATTAREQLDLIVTQDAGYEDDVSVLAESEAVKAPSEEQLQEPSQFERETGIVARPRRGSKAREQLQEKFAGRVSPQIEIMNPEEHNSVKPPESAATVAGVNAQPSHGVFDDEGAG